MLQEQKTRVLAIGLDGATFRIIQPMVAAGQLPHLGRLIAEGVHGVLRSTVQPSSEQAWPTFMTGVQNGKHGIFGFVQRVPSSYAYQYTNALTQRAPTIWHILSARGRRVMSINVPMTYPPEPVNGVLIGGLMTPSERSAFTHPAGLYEELKREIGGYVINVDIETGRLDETGEQQLLAEIGRMTHLRTQAVKYLARTRAWDLLCVVYGAADRVSHKFWRYMDAGEPALKAGKGGVIPEVYRQLDQAIGELLAELVDERTVVVLVSDHGFGPLKKALFLNTWLSQHGYLAWQTPGAESLSSRLRGGLNAGLRRAVHWLNRPWMAAAKRAAFTLWPGLKGKLHSSMAYGKVDWSRTLAYGSGTMGNIYLNVRGREPLGIVEPGAEYERLRERIIADLRALVDPDTGRPVFEQVYRREEIYHGPCLEQAPDVVGLLDPIYHIAAVDWRKAGGDDVILDLGDELIFVGDLTGQHDMDGILIAHGPNVRRGETITGANMVDVAPTMMALLGEAVPEHMDGRVLNDLFVHPLQVDACQGPASPEDAPLSASDGYSPEEADEIAGRLRGLGYLS